MMDWYHELDTEDDFVVPKDEELLDTFPWPDSWQQNLGWPLKKSDLPDHKIVFGKDNESDCRYEFSCNGGWPTEPLVLDRPDFQFNDLMRNDQMDDIFLNSLLKEDLPSTDNTDVKSSDIRSETQFSSAAAESQNLIFHLQSDSDVMQSNFSKSTANGLNDCRVAKACESKLLHPSNEKTSNGEEVSLEEAVLNDLGVSMKRLSKRTRLCFRDSLYRLARNSTKQTLMSDQVEDSVPYDLQEMEDADEQIRSGETTTAESETNTIDRTVANFVFKKVNVNTQDLLSATKHKCEADDKTKGSRYISFSPPEIFDYPPT